MAHRHAAVAHGGKAGVASDVLGDEEGIGLDVAQAPLHVLGPFGKAEGHGGLVVEPGNRRSGHQPRLAGVVGTDPHLLEPEALRQIVTLGDGHRHADRTGGGVAGSNVALQGVRQRRALLGLTQGRGEIEHIGTAVAVEDDRPERLALARITRDRGQRAVREGAYRGRAACQAGLSDRHEGRSDVEPPAAVDRVGPRCSEVVRGAEQDVDDSAPLRLGKACASKATAPAIVGAEKLVPDHRNWVPVSSGAWSR